jgi:beta-lactamase superfamily II metal-dependent hydrolase
LAKEFAMTIDLPDRGFVFWPVGCGDSTTVKVNENVVVQVDIQHHESSEDDDTSYHPVIDTLVEEVLPTLPGEDKPYLAVFALTHPDQDHCKGFEELLSRCTIGELWFSPRIIREYVDDNDLSDDAQAFCSEVNRRIALNQGTEAESGDRIRIIGSDDILNEDDYKDIPADRKSRPGESTTVLDGVDLDGTFRAFFHAPFGDDSTGDRNKTSLAMQVTLTEGDANGRLMMFGDLDYPPLKRIFEYSDGEDKAWDVFLAPHHCSKTAMYYQDDGDTEEVLKQDVLDLIDEAAGDTGWVVVSAVKIPTANQPGENPPHAIAKARYQEISPDGVLCTGDDENSDDPIAFEVNMDGISLYSGHTTGGTSEAAAAVTAARGGDAATGQHVGFGLR